MTTKKTWKEEFDAFQADLAAFKDSIWRGEISEATLQWATTNESLIRLMRDAKAYQRKRPELSLAEAAEKAAYFAHRDPAAFQRVMKHQTLTEHIPARDPDGTNQMTPADAEAEVRAQGKL